MTPFDSPWLKWARGVAHAQTLDAEIKAYLEQSRKQPLGTIRQTYAGRRRGFILTIEDVPPLPRNWNVVLGDAIGNFRAALDHTAWAVVNRDSNASLTARQAKNVYFPIAKSAPAFRSTAKGKLPGVDRDDLSIIRKFQPFQKGPSRSQWHCFALMETLSNTDKHRSIHDIHLVPETTWCWGVTTEDCELRGPIRGYRQPLADGVEIGYVPVKKTGPKPQLNAHYQLMARPAILERLWLDQWMKLTAITLFFLLDEIGEPPAESAFANLDPSFLRDAAQTWGDLASLWSETNGIPKLPNRV